MIGTQIKPSAQPKPARKFTRSLPVTQDRLRLLQLPRINPTNTVRVTKNQRARRLLQLAMALIVLGVICRLLRYVLRFPYWGDEAFLCVNFLNRDYLGLTRQLECFQVAPVLFLWSELTAYWLLGSSEWAMRLLPLLAGLGSLGLFWHLARVSIGFRAAVLAIGLLAVARWPVTMCTSVKPYSFDLFFSLSLLVSAVHYLRRPEQASWLVVLTFLVPIALLSSYPAVFVAGGISVVLLPAIWRNGLFTRAWFVAYNLLMIGTFVGAYLLVSLNQLDPDTGSVQHYMQNYWKHGFPPGGVWSFITWFVQINAGRLMAYPIGDSHGGSTLTLVLFLLGSCVLVARGRWSLLGLCLLPFALNFVAAGLRRYPYGGCCRLSQHLAPAICMLTAVGLCRAIDFMARSATARLQGMYISCSVLALFGLGELLADVAKPYRDKEALWSRKLTQLLLSHGPADAVVIGNHRNEVESLLRWHLGRLGNEFSWDGNVDWERLKREGGDLWYVNIRSGPESELAIDQCEAEVPPVEPGWVQVDHATYSLTPYAQDQPLRICEVSRWVRSGKSKSNERRPALGTWPP